MKLLIIFILTLILFIIKCNGLAVMSIDFGSEWMKVGIVSPGVPMEIALNKESKRKTPAVISFRDNVRSFGDDALTLGLRFPKNTYMYLLDLLGKNITHPLVKLYQQRFPYYDIVEDDERGTILFKNDDDFYSPEELIAQLFVKAKEMAESAAHQTIKECVITVPSFFNQIERKALLQAANLANLKVLQLMNDYLAVGLNYGIFRIKDFNETAQYIMFYDMGASSTSVTIISYQTIKTKERGYLETHPQLSVIGVGFDRTLGGLEIQIRLRDFMAKKFNEMKKTKNDVFQNARAMAKLFKEAGRVKNVLSANAEHYAQIEGLLDEKDFKLLIKRDDLEELCTDLYKRVAKLVDLALKTSHLTKDIINQVVLVGASTRVPKIQEILQNVVGQDLAKNLNTDEAAALGAAYKAADLSSGFQVKKFLTKDAVLYPIQVIFEREVDGNIKQVKRMLFGLMNPYPQKKIITFNKHINDFSFNINYADLDYLQDNEILNIGNFNLSQVNLFGVDEALNKNKGPNIESKGIKAHFAMDDSGILNLINVELVVEKTIIQTEEEGTLSKLGNTISKLFGGDEKTEEKPLTEESTTTTTTTEVVPPQESKNNTNTNQSDINQKQKLHNDKNKENQTDNKNNNTNSNETGKPKIIVHKEPIRATQDHFGPNLFNENQLISSINKLSELDKIERELNRRATALNNLESFVIDVQNKLFEDVYIEASYDEEIEKIRSSCSEISDWLYEDGAEADADIYEKKLKELKLLTKDLFERVYEHNERPEALKALTTLLNHSHHFLEGTKNLTKDKDVLTGNDITNLQKLINDTEIWMAKMILEQDKIKKFEPIKLTLRSINDKMQLLDREVKYLIGKIKLWRPKKTEVPVKEESTTTTTTTATGTNKTDEKPTNHTTNEDTQVNDENDEDSDGTVETNEDEDNSNDKSDGGKTLDEHLEL